MNVILLFILLTIAPQQPQQTGYLVTIVHPGTNNAKCIKTPDQAFVADLFSQHTGLTINTAKVFTPTNNFFEYRTENVHFYCERKRMVKRNGKTQLKNYK